MMGVGGWGRLWGCRSSIWPLIHEDQRRFYVENPAVVDFNMKHPTFVSKVCFRHEWDSVQKSNRFFRKIGKN